MRRVCLVGALSFVFGTGCTGDGESGAGDTDTETDSGGTSGDTESDGTTGATDSGDSSTGGTTGGSTGPVPEPLPPLDDAPLTTEKTLVPSHDVSAEEYLDPRIPADMEQMLSEGWGDEMEGPGEPIVDVTQDGGAAPTPGANPVLLTRFMHLADVQLADDEAATRAAVVDNQTISGGFRPQEGHECHILNAVVRTINAIDQSMPMDFVVLGGDNIDSAQSNELQWFMGLLDGGVTVHCDSGDDDDPVAGPDNDPKDPLSSNGLNMPWKWVAGNHDVLVQGNFTVASQSSIATSDMANGGTRDWSMPGGPVVTGQIVPDDRRELLDRVPMLEAVMGAGDGHGIDQATVDYGKAYYTFDVGDDIRMVIVDSAAETGAESGVIHQADIDAFLRPALDTAEADGRWVILASHHGTSSMGDGGGLGGTVQDDALDPADWVAFLGEYPNVIAHLAGHSHVHRATLMEPTGGNPYWEVKTAAIADWPHQMRLVEIRDEDNGFLSLTGIAVDYSVEGDPISADGRKRGVSDMTTGWQLGGAGDVEDRNVRLWWAKP